MKRKITVVTARPISGHVRERVNEIFRRKFPGGTETEYCVDEELIGGIRIFDGEKLYEGSLQGRLEAVEEELLHD